MATVRTLSDSMLRYRGGKLSLSSGWEDLAFMDVYNPSDTAGTVYQQPVSSVATSSGNDVGTGFNLSSIWSGITQLGTTYLQTQSEQKNAQLALNRAGVPGSTTTVMPNGAIQTTTAPFVMPSSVSKLLSNPLVWAAGGLAAVLLLKKRRR